ncbi:MAG: hypothetical protein KAW56_09345, partial [Candidatus Marinimicrobia bacterium]|nr:hypothetical protein [Candidatus Neomarinimicrobiota bacterium]
MSYIPPIKPPVYWATAQPRRTEKRISELGPAAAGHPVDKTTDLIFLLETSSIKTDSATLVKFQPSELRRIMFLT